ADRAGPDGGAVDRRVVDHPWHAVAREAHVEFEGADAQRVGELEGGQRVLRREAGRAAVTDDEGPPHHCYPPKSRWYDWLASGESSRQSAGQRMPAIPKCPMISPRKNGTNCR